jgi:hypothetical protein
MWMRDKRRGGQIKSKIVALMNWDGQRPDEGIKHRREN